jgi:hypothetical protein
VSAPVLAFNNPKPKRAPRRSSPDLELQRKFARLIQGRPAVAIVVERLIDDLLAGCDDEKGGA